MASASHPIKIAIAGGGYCGLVLARTLAQYGSPDHIEINVYETRHHFDDEIGAGITIRPRSFQILEALGLGSALETLDPDVLNWHSKWKLFLRRSDSEVGIPITTMGQSHAVSFHRGEFLAMLAAGLPAHAHVHFGKRVVDCSQGGLLTLSDGSTASYDVLLGCDGVKSVVRGAMYESAAASAPTPDEAARFHQIARPRWSGATFYRFLVPMEKFVETLDASAATRPHPIEQGTRMVYQGLGKFIIVYPIKQGKVLNALAIISTHPDDAKILSADSPWVSTATSEEMLQHFKGWEEQAQVVLKSAPSPTKWEAHEVGPLPYYAKGNSALLGDAAHSMTPFLGMGANSAIEDAYLLGRLLAHPKATEKIEEALATYDSLRRQQDIMLVKVSAENGARMAFHGSEGEDLDKLRESLDRIDREILNTPRATLEDDIHAALKAFETKIAST